MSRRVGARLAGDHTASARSAPTIVADPRAAVAGSRCATTMATHGPRHHRAHPSCRSHVEPFAESRSLTSAGIAIYSTLQVEYMTAPVSNPRLRSRLDPTRRGSVPLACQWPALVTRSRRFLRDVVSTPSRTRECVSSSRLVRLPSGAANHHIALDPRPIRRLAGWASSLATIVWSLPPRQARAFPQSEHEIRDYLTIAFAER